MKTPGLFEDVTKNGPRRKFWTARCAAAMLNGPSVNLKMSKGRFTFRTWSVYDWGLHLRFQRFDSAVLETFSRNIPWHEVRIEVVLIQLVLFWHGKALYILSMLAMML